MKRRNTSSPSDRTPNGRYPYEPTVPHARNTFCNKICNIAYTLFHVNAFCRRYSKTDWQIGGNKTVKTCKRKQLTTNNIIKIAAKVCKSDGA